MADLACNSESSFSALAARGFQKHTDTRIHPSPKRTPISAARPAGQPRGRDEGPRLLPRSQHRGPLTETRDAGRTMSKATFGATTEGEASASAGRPEDPTRTPPHPRQARRPAAAAGGSAPRSPPCRPATPPRHGDAPKETDARAPPGAATTAAARGPGPGGT